LKVTFYKTNKNRKYLQLPDCYNQTGSNCPTPCVKCGNGCYFANAVKKISDTHCLPLSGKMIAKKMLNIYAILRNITGQDPKSMTFLDIEKQLNFFEPQTQKEFQEKYRFTDEYVKRGTLMFKHPEKKRQAEIAEEKRLQQEEARRAANRERLLKLRQQEEARAKSEREQMAFEEEEKQSNRFRQRFKTEFPMYSSLV
jgi:hypothetical protein